MKKNPFLYAFLVCVCWSNFFVTKAQDPHLSQYFTSPMNFNPALIGKGVGDWRAMATFRSQWWGESVAPYNTTSLSIEKSIRSGTVDKSILGFGFSLLTDASNSGLLKNNYFSGGTAYNIALDGAGTAFLGIGLEATFANRLLDASKFEFQSQFGSMGFQRSAPSGDPVNILSNTYWDVNMGLHFSKTYKTWEFGLGGAIFHASQPTGGVLNNSSYSVERRASLQAGMGFYMKNKDQLLFSGIADFQGSNSIYTLGALYKAKLHDKLESLNIGVFKRFDDAVYPYVAMEAKSWMIGLSYDVVNSNIKNSYNSVQSMEVSLAWFFGKKRDPANRPENILVY